MNPHLPLLRFLDVTAALAGGLIAFPAVLVLGVLVRSTSSGPALFKQVRLGRGERTFTCYKLRTMARDTPNAASHQVASSHVTPLGALLRRLKLDELPQLWNVLRGDMSLVGPRPGLPQQAELTQARRAAGVFAVRPGVTGPAQVQGIDMSTPELLAETDRIYADRPTVGAYFRYVVMTAFGRGQGDAVGR